MDGSVIIAIGDELLLGQTIDTNSAWIGTHMSKIGCPVLTKYTVSDSREAIISAIREAREQSDVILLTGGLGPTRDDITKKVLAEYFGVELVFNEEAWQIINEYFQKMGRRVSELHRLQCYLPANAHLLENKAGTAPGMLFEENGKVIISLPGVPYEMEYIMRNSVLPLIAARSVKTVVHKTIRTFGLPESTIAEKLEKIEDELPAGMRIAYLPSLGEVKLRVTCSGAKTENLNLKLEKVVGDMELLLGSYVYGYDDESLEEVVSELLRAGKYTLSLAESCTGGKLASRIVSLSGSGDFFHAGLVTYSNKMKEELLGVSPVSLKQFGAVSKEVATEMLEGLLKVTGTDLGVSITGMAGPSGDNENKPVGTVFIGVGNRERKEIRQYLFSKDRKSNIQFFSSVALNMLRKFLIER